MSKVEPAITFVNDFDRFYHFELEKISKVNPAMTFVNDLNRFCHFELQQISKVDPAKRYKSGVGAPPPPCT